MARIELDVSRPDRMSGADVVPRGKCRSMRKWLMGSFVVAMLGAQTCHAQSSVTLYGLIDEGVSYLNNRGGAPSVFLLSGLYAGSRFGLTGKEDLGGGYSAIFKLENGFDINSGKLGQGGRMFGRQAYVGVATPVGTVTLGNQYDATVDLVSPILCWGKGVSSHYDLDNACNDWRTPNSIKYAGEIGGLKYSFLYSLGGQAGHMGRNSVWSAGVSYRAGHYLFAASHTSVDSPYDTWFGGAGASSIATFGAYLPSATRLSVTAGGAMWDNDHLSLRLGGSHNVLSNASQGSDVRVENLLVQEGWSATPQLKLYLTQQWSQVAVQAPALRKNYLQINFMTQYMLSKRTTAYFVTAFQHAFSDADIAQIGLLPSSSSNKQYWFHVGMIHTF